SIVFVHGLLGHPRETWETAKATAAASANHGSSGTMKRYRGLKSWFQRRANRSVVTSTEQVHIPTSSPTSSAPALAPSTVFWPEEYLAVDIPQARVWTYGYNADVVGAFFGAQNRNSISEHGRDLSVKLERQIDNEKPLAFVVHSLGGIVLKDAIRRSETMRDRTKLVIFLGTPHRGSTYADWGQIASNLARLVLHDSNKMILKTLEVNSEVLENIQEEFIKIVHNGDIKIHSFQEARAITVENFSSKLGLLQESVETIDANHMQMVRYSSKSDQGYQNIHDILK
ncbi:hypothetical protein J3E72DRAFT_176595, partial [Bipolaris maydis]